MSFRTNGPFVFYKDEKDSVISTLRTEECIPGKEPDKKQGYDEAKEIANELNYRFNNNITKYIVANFFNKEVYTRGKYDGLICFQPGNQAKIKIKEYKSGKIAVSCTNESGLNKIFDVSIEEFYFNFIR